MRGRDRVLTRNARGCALGGEADPGAEHGGGRKRRSNPPDALA
jgi:hypothetical protein